MNEMTMNSACMYDEVEGIRSLNKVEGFDPRKYMRLIQNEGQAGKYYLDVAYRKLWFRLRYPEGKIVKKILKLTEQVAIVEARVYLDRNDHEDNFISNALAQKYMSADGQFGNKFVELAETAAVGRALSDAGFGLQFADREGDMDPEVTEAPFDPQMIAGAGGALPEGTYMDSALQEGAAGDGEVLQEEAFPGQYGMRNTFPCRRKWGRPWDAARHASGRCSTGSRRTGDAGNSSRSRKTGSAGNSPHSRRTGSAGNSPRSSKTGDAGNGSCSSTDAAACTGTAARTGDAARHAEQAGSTKPRTGREGSRECRPSGSTESRERRREYGSRKRRQCTGGRQYP